MFCRHADCDRYGNCNSHRHTGRYRDCNCNSRSNSDLNRFGNRNPDTNSHTEPADAAFHSELVKYGHDNG